MKKVGIVGCGNISDIYIINLLKFGYDVRISDLSEDLVREKLQKYKELKSSSPDEIYTSDVDAILCLTPPRFHTDVLTKALNCGKHAYSEKPLGIDFEKAKQVVDLAKSKNLRLGCAPDTFFGGIHQTSKRFLESGFLGKIYTGNIKLMMSGPDNWHPNPGFFYDIGGGPMLDMGVYYITIMANHFGSAKKVIAYTFSPDLQRTIKAGKNKGQKLDVKVPTTYMGAIEYENGAVINMSISFNGSNDDLDITYYAEHGTFKGTDPNMFGGNVKTKVYFDGKSSIKNPVGIEIETEADDWVTLKNDFKYNENSRSVGLIDMLQAEEKGLTHRANGNLGLHVLEILTSFEKSSKEQKPIELQTKIEKIQPLNKDLEEGILY